MFVIIVRSVRNNFRLLFTQVHITLIRLDNMCYIRELSRAHYDTKFIILVQYPSDSMEIVSLR